MRRMTAPVLILGSIGCLWLVGVVLSVQWCLHQAPEESGGVYRWTNLARAPFDGQRLAFRREIAVAPSGSVFVASGDREVFRSTDGGRHWDRLTLDTRECSVYAICVTADGTVLAGTGRGVYRSTDDGEHWTIATAKLPPMGVFCFATSGSRVYAGGSNRTVLKSTDNGRSWTMAMRHRYADAVCQEAGVYCVGVTESDVAYAGIGSQGVYRSTDGGRHWTNLTPEWDTASIAEASADYDNMPTTDFRDMAADQTGRMYIASDVSYYRRSGKNSSDHYIMRCDPADRRRSKLYLCEKSARCRAVAVGREGRLVAGTDEGLFVSCDAGRTWKPEDCSNSMLLRFAGLGPGVASIAVDSRGRVWVLSFSGDVFCGVAR